MPAVVHFDIPTDNPANSVEFYNKLFGWKIEKVPGDMEYWMVSTKDGEVGIDGGIYKRKTKEQTPVNYVQVKDIDEYIKKVKDLGGNIIVPKTVIENMGQFFIFTDQDNNPLGIWQDK